MKSIETTLAQIGEVQFFKSPNNKKVREEMAELFFLLALQKQTKSDWYLMQPKDDPPDFVLVNVDNDSSGITLEQFELVEIPARCGSFEEMAQIIQDKLDKGYPSNYSLLIFVNHERSKEWIGLLNSQPINFGQLKAIWTVCLLWYKEKNDLFGPLVNRIYPQPLSIEAELSQTKLSYSKGVPPFMETTEVGGKTFISFKADFIKEFRRKVRILRNKSNPASETMTS